ncbi:Uncharacterized protein FWK35_00036762 [Aphis craccivora]|uniref:C2H2-type domain-containing protein n=1 Tax=Aphis craccivora TaxID=307492 RepID=A0A6G0VLX7_APHCR|nr:Uncharacterized protein FWK35_00036762 [Aphis craccivora]
MYKCDMCPAVFKMKWNLARHVNTHNGLRYSCTVCEKKYTDNSNLNKHMKNVHDINLNLYFTHPRHILFSPLH